MKRTGGLDAVLVVLVPDEAKVAVALAVNTLGVHGALNVLALVARDGGRAGAHAVGDAAVDLALAAGPVREMGA